MSKITFKQKLFACLAYVFTVNFPLGIIVIYLLDDSEYVRFHTNRNIILSCFITAKLLLMKNPNFSNSAYPITIFVFLCCLLGLIQILLSNNKCLLIFDKIPFISMNGTETKYIYTILTTVIIIIISICYPYLITNLNFPKI